MARPYWSGSVQISLVSFTVRLFSATESKSQISFREISRKTGERVHHQNVTESEGPIERSNIVKGYEFGKGEYVVLEPKELEALRIPSKRTWEIKQFVDLHDIDLAYFEKPYFVTPENEEQASTFGVIREALAETGKAGLGEVAFGGREHLVALMPATEKDSNGMMAYTLRYAEELRDSAPIFGEIKASKIDADQLKLAKELIRRNSTKFNPTKFKDDYEAALREVIEAKVKHKALPRETIRRGKVINLTDALRRSLSGKSTKSSPVGGSQSKRSASRGSKRPKRKGPVLVASTARRRKTA